MDRCTKLVQVLVDGTDTWTRLQPNRGRKPTTSRPEPGNGAPDSVECFQNEANRFMFHYTLAQRNCHARIQS